MNVLEKYAKLYDLHSVSVGIWPKWIGTPHAYTAYVHWKDPDNLGFSSSCSTGWGQTEEEAIQQAIEEKTT